MKNSKWFLTASLAAVIAFTSLSVIASADEGEMPEDKPMQQNHEEVKAAIASGDYNAFAEVAPEKMLEQINADNFGRFVEMHDHLESAKAIADELGLEKMGHKGQKKGHMKGNEEVREAIANGDYAAFVEVAPEKMLEVINADNFSRLIDFHTAIENKDFETAKEIKDELGMPDRHAKGQKGFDRNR